jgi:hypothetical protein
MIISNSKNYIFFHPPKSGGTSVTKYLSNEAMWNDIIIGGTEEGEFFQKFYSSKYKIFKHTSPQELINVIGLKKYRGYYKFVVVRNPVERFISTYNFIKDLYDKKVEWFLRQSDLELIDSISTFDYFVESSFVRKSLQKNVLNSSDIEKCIIPQAGYFDDEEMNAGRFDFFRLEDLKNSCVALVACKVTDSLYKFERLNSSSHSLKKEDLEFKTLNIISNYYKIDYEKFDYQF